MKDFLRVLKYFRSDGARIGGVFVLMVLNVGLNVLKPWPVALLIDSVLGGKPWPGRRDPIAFAEKPRFVMMVSVAILFVYFAQGFFAAFQNYYSIQISLRGLTRLRGELFDRLVRLSLRFHQKTNAGDLIYRATWDSYSVQTLFQQGLMTIAGASLSLVVMGCIMFRLNFPLTLASMAMAPLLIIGLRYFAVAMKSKTTVAQQSDSVLTSLVQRAIFALPLVQSYTLEKTEIEHFAAAAGDAQAKRISQHGWELAYGFTVAIIFGFGTAVTTWLGARQVLVGNLTLGELFVFLSYLVLFYEPLSQLSFVGTTVAGALAGSRRVFEILDTPEEVKTPAEPVAATAAGGLAFRNVSFAYDTGREVLRDVSFSLSPGESLAIVGPSGAGKTTLLQLLPRFFDPTSGGIEIGGVDLRRWDLAELRRNLGVVLQEPIILPATVAENIACGKPGATKEEIIEAARAANALGFIEKLPDGFQTRIGDGAARFSVGERQRINLARAFLKNAPIILLDEPTSALDGENAALIAESLRTLLRGRIGLMVAHRYATIASFQKILVLENGCVTESGPPLELQGRRGYFARMKSGAELVA